LHQAAEHDILVTFQICIKQVSISNLEWNTSWRGLSSFRANPYGALVRMRPLFPTICQYPDRGHHRIWNSGMTVTYNERRKPKFEENSRFLVKKVNLMA